MNISVLLLDCFKVATAESLLQNGKCSSSYAAIKAAVANDKGPAGLAMNPFSDLCSLTVRLKLLHLPWTCEKKCPTLSLLLHSITIHYPPKKQQTKLQRHKTLLKRRRQKHQLYPNPPPPPPPKKKKKKQPGYAFTRSALLGAASNLALVTSNSFSALATNSQLGHGSATPNGENHRV